MTVQTPRISSQRPHPGRMQRRSWISRPSCSTVILSQVARPGDAATVAENMLRRIAQPVRLDGGERKVTASVGVAVYPGDGELADTLVRAADTAMYHAKKQGGDRYAFFERRMRQGA